MVELKPIIPGPYYSKAVPAEYRLVITGDANGFSGGYEVEHTPELRMCWEEAATLDELTEKIAASLAQTGQRDGIEGLR